MARLTALIATLGVVVVAGRAVAARTVWQKPAAVGSQPGKSPAKVPVEPPAFTAEREAAAMMFVRQHHAELAELLGQLKSANPAEYEQAIRELFQTSESLGELQGKDSRRYEIDLRAWRVGSRVKLLTAKLGMGKSGAVEEELKAALLEQIEVRIDRQRLDRERAAARLEKLDATIAALEQDRSKAAEFNRLTKSAGAARTKAEQLRGKATKAKPEKKPTEKPGQK